MKNPRLLACLFSIALGASVAFALPTGSIRPASNHAASNDAGSRDAQFTRNRTTVCERREAGQRRFNWRTLVEAMLPPALRARAHDSEPCAERLDSTLLVDEFADLARIARRVAGNLS